MLYSLISYGLIDEKTAEQEGEDKTENANFSAIAGAYYNTMHKIKKYFTAES